MTEPSQAVEQKLVRATARRAAEAAAPSTPPPRHRGSKRASSSRPSPMRRQAQTVPRPLATEPRSSPARPLLRRGERDLLDLRRDYLAGGGDRRAVGRAGLRSGRLRRESGGHVVGRE